MSEEAEKKHTVMVAGAIYRKTKKSHDGRAGNMAICLATSPGSRGRARLFTFRDGWDDVVQEHASSDDWEMVANLFDVIEDLEDLKTRAAEVRGIFEEIEELRSKVKALEGKAAATELAPPQPATTRRVGRRKKRA